VHAYPLRRRPRIDLRIGPHGYRGIATERRDYPDGRIALRLLLYPAPPDGERIRWYYWHPDAMRVSSSASATSSWEERPQPGDAVRVRHERRGDGDCIPPIPETRQYVGADRPQLRVRVGGQWHPAVLHIRIRLADGRHQLTLRVCFQEDDWPVWYWRTYWWNPEAIRLRQADEAEAPEDEETAVEFDPDALDEGYDSRLL
jgi:hypothetical protein